MNDMEYVVNYWATYPAIEKYRNTPGQPHIVTYYPKRFKPIYDAWKGYVDGNSDIAWIYLAVAEDGSAFFTPEDQQCQIATMQGRGSSTKEQKLTQAKSIGLPLI